MVRQGDVLLLPVEIVPEGRPLPAEGGRPIAAASVAGDPPRTRVAWIGDDGAVVARVACPPARPSRWHPVVATAVTLSEPSGASDRLVAARAAPGGAGETSGEHGGDLQ